MSSSEDFRHRTILAEVLWFRFRF